MFDLKHVRRMQARALSKGARQLSPSTVEWDIAGRCESPVLREIIGGVPHGFDPLRFQQIRNKGFARLILHTRCRKCGQCLRLRAMNWRDRAIIETRCAPRTWFCTFTARPEAHHKMWLQACQRLRKSGVSPESISLEREFNERSREFGKLLTDYFKRVRKQPQTQIRYLLVSEAVMEHQKGLPHFHALIHDYGQLTYRQLTGEWFAGFIQAKLVDDNDKAARYVTKYVAKQAVSRIRASLGYGTRSISIAAEAKRIEMERNSGMERRGVKKPSLSQEQNKAERSEVPESNGGERSASGEKEGVLKQGTTVP